MKKLLLMLYMALFPSAIFAKSMDDAETLYTSTVKSIESKHDDKKVMLEGYIAKQINEAHYIFKDDSGEVKVEIDSEEFKDVTLSPSTKVRITGEIDKEWGKTIVDVDHVAVIN